VVPALYRPTVQRFETQCQPLKLRSLTSEYPDVENVKITKK